MIARHVCSVIYFWISSFETTTTQFEHMLKRLSLFFLVCSCIGGMAMGQKAEREASLKAVFIYNFTKYVEWDTSGGERDFTIGVIGASPVTRSLYEIARTSTVKNRRMIIRVFSKPEEISGCQVLFIPKSLPYSLSSVLENTRKNVLTISEEAGYAKQGTAFNFIIQNDKLKFEANLKALSLAGLKVGVQLLKLATIVD